MGFYNVVRPCVVGKLHYATIPAQPIEVDDDVAAPLVESGDLAPYAPGGVTAGLVGMSYSMRHPEGVPFVVPFVESPADLGESTFTEEIEPGAFKESARRSRTRRPKSEPQGD